MSVLIGITSKNRFEILPKAINSALNQSFSPLKVTVFDDNSSDRTNELVKDFPTVGWEISNVNRGLVYARNRMMQNASEKYFCSLDDDAWFVEKDALAYAVQYMESNADTAAIAFDILSPDRPKRLLKSPPFEVANFIGCGHLLRLSAVREVGYYDPNPSYYGAEEKDLGIKLINKNYKIVLMPGVHVWHDKTNVARDEKKQHASGVCNDFVFTYRRLPLLFLFPGLFLKIFSHLRFAILFRKGYLLSAALEGIKKFLVLLLGFNLIRKPVSISAFRKYRRLVVDQQMKVSQLMKDNVSQNGH